MSESMASCIVSVGELPKRVRKEDAAAGRGEARTQLMDLAVSLVEDYQRDRHEKTPEGFCEVYQVCLPYKGLGVWHVGHDDVVADANQVLFVRGGESYRLSGPVAGGYAELIITPAIELLSEIIGAGSSTLFDHPLFRNRCGLASPRLQSFRARFLHWAAPAADGYDLEAEELVIALLRVATQREPASQPCGAATARLVKRTKYYLEQHLADQIRLVDVGRAVGASPAYLTDTFRRVEGLSLHRYLTQLRLARALAELPHANDLTALALNTGFSSHSHFTAAFRRAFGCTPSQFRLTTRTGIRPVGMTV
jgi:AraC family transcriptional regulator